jgi:hypothetical protein
MKSMAIKTVKQFWKTFKHKYKVNNLIKKQLKEDFDAEMTFTEPNKS